MNDFSGIITAMQGLVNSFQGLFSTSFNLQLFIPQQGNIIYNEETGNYEPSNQIEVIYNAYVKVVKNERIDIIIGSDFNKIAVVGYLVTPLNFSEEIPVKVSAKILNDGSWVDGLFFRELNLEDSLLEDYRIRETLGDKISGYFELKDNINS